MARATSPLHPDRPLFWLLVVVAVAIAAAGFWPRAVAVEVGRIERGPLEVGFREQARTRLRKDWQVSAPVDGTVERIDLRPGDVVRAGQVVAVLRPARSGMLDPANRAQAIARLDAAEHAVQVAQSAVTAATAERKLAGVDQDRIRALAAEALVAQADLDRARTRTTAADATLRQARATLAMARSERDAARAVIGLEGARDGQRRIDLPAPIDGRIMQRLVESATPVHAGQPLLEIGDPGAIEVVAEVLTADAVRLAPGAPVVLSRWGGDGELHGHVSRVEPAGFTKISALGVEEQRVLVVVALDEPKARYARLGAGYQLDAAFVVWRAPDVVLVPTAALFRDGPAWAVYAIERGRAHLRRVVLGHIGEEAAQVERGLRPGEAVVLYPGDAVHDGQRIRARP